MMKVLCEPDDLRQTIHRKLLKDCPDFALKRGEPDQALVSGRAVALALISVDHTVTNLG
jgi:hypothetical protein